MLTSIITLMYQKSPMFQDFITRLTHNQFLDCNMSDFRSKHPKSENDEFKLVSEIISFSKFENLSYFEEKERASGLHFFTNLNF